MMQSTKPSAALALYASLAACALAIFAGCHGKPGLTDQQAEGKHFYDERCAHCHEENDLNLKKVPPNLHGLFNKTTLPSGAPATDAEVQGIVLAGKGRMPAFKGRFDNEQMEALLAYLHTGMQDQHHP